MTHTSAHSAPQARQPQAAATPTGGFAALGLHKLLLDILARRSITSPTPIQAQSIPVVLQGNDVIGIAQTGTGKTLAFALPLMQRLLAQASRGGVRPGTSALVLVPTRELAQQVYEVCTWFAQALRVQAAVVIGGVSMDRQVSALRRQPAIVIATPGRLIDHMRQGTVRLPNIQYLVLDEADRMFDMGFAPQIREIFKHIGTDGNRQTLLFSATMPESIADMVKQYMHTPVRVEIARAGSTAEGVQQEMIIIDKEHQYPALLTLLDGVKETILIFTRTKHHAKKLAQKLGGEGYKVEELHSNRSQAQRKRAVDAIQTRRAQILVATDIAARGIDISHIGIVINYELPNNPEDYVHRIGRTGRAGRKGRAILFVLSDQGQELRRIQKFISTPIQQIEVEGVPSAQLRGGATSGGAARGRTYTQRQGRRPGSHVSGGRGRRFGRNQAGRSHQ